MAVQRYNNYGNCEEGVPKLTVGNQQATDSLLTGY